jgi:ribosomal protein S18 acetylase RimI-like enzyme
LILTENDMKIRRVTPQDADALARVHIDSWRSAYRGLVPDSQLAKLDYATRARRFRQALGEHAEETYLAEENGEALGFLTVGECRDGDVDRQKTGEIWGIYMAPAHWRRGVGRSLCRYGENLLRSRGYTTATLWVFAGNGQAKSFYEAMGFRPDGASKTLQLGVPLEAIRYRKELDPAQQGAAADAGGRRR